MQPEREIRLIQSAPDMPWEWALLHQGRTLACGPVRSTLAPDTLRAAVTNHGARRFIRPKDRPGC